MMLKHFFQRYFEFEFSHATLGEDVYIYRIPLGNFYKAYTWSENEDCIDATDDLESEYGVHDFNASGIPTDSSTMWMSFGFSSYEVDPSKFDELIQKWKDILERVGGEPREIQLHKKGAAEATPNSL